MQRGEMEALSQENIIFIKTAIEPIIKLHELANNVEEKAQTLDPKNPNTEGIKRSI